MPHYRQIKIVFLLRSISEFKGIRVKSIIRSLNDKGEGRLIFQDFSVSIL